jgi:hypothetical protein
MKSSVKLVALIVVALVGFAQAQNPKPNQKQKKDQDLPDVSLQIPEDTRPEVKAILKANAIALSSKKVTQRVKAAIVLGELGEGAKPARGLLCLAMLDPSPAVRVAAADALKSVDPKMQYLAVALLIEQDTLKQLELLTKVEKLEEDGQPLSPLVAYRALQSARKKSSFLTRELTVLSHIAKSDLVACSMIASALDNLDQDVRKTALEALARMKHGGLATLKMVSLLAKDTPSNRIVAIKALTAVADRKNEEVIAVAIAAQRYHDDEAVRKAVEEGLNKLQNKKEE